MSFMLASYISLDIIETWNDLSFKEDVILW